MPWTLATWNVNSIRARETVVLDWIRRRQPDVLCLQETKVVDDTFPRAGFAELGYHVEVYGQPTYNGVAILSRSREPLSEVRRGFADGVADEQARALTALRAGVRIVDVYVPNGQEVGSDKFAYKLEWLRRLRAYLDSFPAHEDLVVCGDFNVAPDDRDVWDPEKWRDQVLCHPDERAALAHVIGWGLADALRIHDPSPGVYSWWDYRMNAFRRKLGLRIDLVLASPGLASRCTACDVDVDPRRGDKPSDHAPVIATFRDA